MNLNPTAKPQFGVWDLTTEKFRGNHFGLICRAFSCFDCVGMPKHVLESNFDKLSMNKINATNELVIAVHSHSNDFQFYEISYNIHSHVIDLVHQMLRNIQKKTNLFHYNLSIRMLLILNQLREF